jgi:L-lactate dehydrogenase (cytochrome)
MSSFSFLRFFPSVLNPVTEVDSSTMLFGKKTPIPMFFAPTGSSSFSHPEGEFNVTEIAARTGIPQCLSSTSSKSLEEVLERRDQLEREGKGRARLWWQLYVRNDRDLSTQRIKDAVNGGVESIVFTVDTPVLGKRENDKGVAAQGMYTGGNGKVEKPSLGYDGALFTGS